MAFEPGAVAQMDQKIDGIEGGEGQFNIECEYNKRDIYDIFNVIQFQILLIDIRDEIQYKHGHIRQAYHINKVIEILSNSNQDLFVSKDTSLPIYIYDQSMFDEKKNENILNQLYHLLIVNGYIENEDKIQINVLKDGFTAFHQQFKFECTDKVPHIPYQYKYVTYCINNISHKL